MEPTLFRGRSVCLTALSQADAPSLAGWYQDAEFLRLLDSRPAYPKSAAQLGQWLEELQKGEHTFAFGVRLVDNDELIGYLEVDEVDWQHGVCGLGVGIGDRTYWGKGYGREAVCLALEFAFDELNLHRVQATVFEYNVRSIALFEGLGFRREGTFREFLKRDGKRHDMILYGLLRHEWARPAGTACGDGEHSEWERSGSEALQRKGTPSGV